MSKEIGPRERQLREQREARFAARNREPNSFEDAARGRDPAPTNPVAKATKGKTGTAGVKGPVRRSTAGTGLQVGAAGADQPDGGERPPTNLESKRGRPKKGEVRAKPWEAEGISKASYYRRQAEKRSN